MVTQRGIEVNLDQIKAVMETSSPSSKKELQRLMGRLAAFGFYNLIYKQIKALLPHIERR